MNRKNANHPPKKEKQKLIFTMLLLTSIPGMTNIFSGNMGNYSMYFSILPQKWLNLYPITYYLIGIYLSEYPLKLRRSVNFALILLTAVISGSVCYWRSLGDVFESGIWQSYSSGFVVIQAVLVFSFLSQIPLKLTGMPAKVVTSLSNLCFSAYLVSYIFDDLVYGWLGLGENNSVYRLEYFVVTVPLIIVCSLALSGVIQVISKALCQVSCRVFGNQKTTSEVR